MTPEEHMPADKKAARYSRAADECQRAADRFVDALGSLPTGPQGGSLDRGACLAGADLAESLRDRFARAAGELAGGRKVER